jgi:adenylate cyclase
MARKSLIALLISLIILLVTYALYSFGFFEKPEFFAYDTRAKLFRMEKTPPSTVKVILIDDASLKALEGVAGRWPWPRAIWADLIEFLSLGGARAVLFDIMFTERSSTEDASNDLALAEATLSSQNIYHSMVINRWKADDDRKANSELGQAMPADFLERFAVRSVSGGLPLRRGSESNDFTLPIEQLLPASKGIAVVEFSPDRDGVLRRTKPLREYQGRYFPVLGIAPFIDEKTHISIEKGYIRMNDRTIPVDGEGNYLINMLSIEKAAAYSIGGIFASLQRIKKGEVEDLIVNPEEFKDCIVFVGASAVGLKDLKPTPLSQSAPGVIFHVSLAANYLQNDFLKPADRRITYLSILLGACFVPWVVFYSKRFFLRAVFPLFMLVLFLGISLAAFRSNQMVDTVPFVFATISSSFLSFGYVTFAEAAEKRRVSHLFTQYVSKDVLNEVLHNYKEYMKSSAGQKVELTVLFSDIRGFTTMSETTPPEKIVEMLNVHFSVMADIILKHNGTIDKYIGDAIMAFWGAPVRTADHAEKAILAAQEMVAAVKEVNAVLKEKGFEHEVKIGIGVNTGIATIGEIGSEKKKNYTIVGDAVNLASRLESITKEYKSTLIFSEYTYDKIKDRIPGRELGNVKVKGREQPVRIFTTG